MSASAARRRKQKALKAASGGAEPVSSRLNSLIGAGAVDESTAYEALQLAQSQVRRLIKTGQYKEGVEAAYDVSLTLLEKHGRVSVASQLMTELVRALLECHIPCTDDWVTKLTTLSQAYVQALEGITSGDVERNRLSRLHLKFLRSALRWSDLCGLVRFGALGVHELVGNHSWRLSQIDHSSVDDEDDDEQYDYNAVGLKCEAVTHLALAENPLAIGALLQEQCPDPTKEELAAGHDSPPALRDVLLTRAILVLASVENLRDAHTLLQYYLKHHAKSEEELKVSYMSKTDGLAPNHAIFNSMLISICTKDEKTAPLFNWLLRSFQSELSKMYKPDLLKAYTTRIGRIYFNIQPPPSMLSTIENMMGMMGGGGGGMGGGGMPPINPQMMQQMMQSMGGM